MSIADKARQNAVGATMEDAFLVVAATVSPNGEVDVTVDADGIEGFPISALPVVLGVLQKDFARRIAEATHHTGQDLAQ